jgi:glycosyltransferase involved in cell wall biosynthesis
MTPDLNGRRALLVTFGSLSRPDGGLMVRARLTLEALTGLGMRVSVISHQEPHDARRQLALAGLSELIVLNRPLRYGFSRELAQSVRALAPQVDVMIVESALLLPAAWAGGHQIPIVWDTNECETLHYQRLPPSVGVLSRRLVWRGLEGWAARVSDVVVAIGDEEAQAWGTLFPRLQGRTVSVAHRAFIRPSQPWRPESVAASVPMLLFVGSLVGKHNAEAAEWLVTVLAPRLPGGTALVLAGPGTDSLVRSSATEATICCLGRVDDVDGLIAAADVCLAPLRAGAGVKTKVLHYLAHGKPVIATPAALEGLAGAPGVVAVAMHDFVDEVLRATSPVDREGQGQRAALQRDWLERHHGAAMVSDQWAKLLGSVLAGSPRVTAR